GLGFLQKPDDLLFRKALLHVRLLLRKRTLLDSGWPCLQGAGHYLETAFRIRDKEVQLARRALLNEPGTLTTEEFLEPVPRYEQVPHTLQELVDLDTDSPLEEFDRDARRAFVELALSGLFPGTDSDSEDIRRQSTVQP
ncbi:hypothetical protein QZM74_30760, partial [Burkholderia multivorans]|nr:hypothetical protein [Burkholderia multivorans]